MRTANTISAVDAAWMRATPKSVSPKTSASWWVPTFAGASGRAVPTRRITVMAHAASKPMGSPQARSAHHTATH
ncbi:MAG: hypothetical protein ABI811_23230 [Acidobacteriota bacterium]